MKFAIHISTASTKWKIGFFESMVFSNKRRNQYFKLFPSFANAYLISKRGGLFMKKINKKHFENRETLESYACICIHHCVCRTSLLYTKVKTTNETKVKSYSN